MKTENLPELDGTKILEATDAEVRVQRHVFWLQFFGLLTTGGSIWVCLGAHYLAGYLFILLLYRKIIESWTDRDRFKHVNMTFGRILQRVEALENPAKKAPGNE